LHQFKNLLNQHHPQKHWKQWNVLGNKDCRVSLNDNKKYNGINRQMKENDKTAHTLWRMS